MVAKVWDQATEVERYRIEMLILAGYPTNIATKLALTYDVDLHVAVDMIEQGCTPELAKQILL